MYSSNERVDYQSNKEVGHGGWRGENITLNGSSDIFMLCGHHGVFSSSTEVVGEG